MDSTPCGFKKWNISANVCLGFFSGIQKNTLVIVYWKDGINLHFQQKSVNVTS